MIDATFEHSQGYKFNIRYQSKRAFLAACSRSKNCKLDNAVDHSSMQVVYPNTLQEYRNSK